MATTRIKDITTAASTFSSDDFVAIDGATLGTRKMAKADLITEVSTGVSGTYLEESNNLSDVASKDTSKLNLEVPDVGTAPNEVPMNGQLGTMAYQSAEAVSVAQLQGENAGLNASPTDARLTITDSTNDCIHLTADESTLQGPYADTQIRMGGNIVVKGVNNAFLTTGSNAGIAVDNQGRVGIATSSPTGPLTVRVAADKNLVVKSQYSGASLEAANDAYTANVPLAIYGAPIRLLNGNVEVSSGNVVMTGGGGIDFGAVASGSGTPTPTVGGLLDDFETGTWSPVIAPNTGSFATASTYVYFAKYTKVGNVVTANCYIRTDGTLDTTGGSGSVRIEGLPFTIPNSDFASVDVGYAYNWSAAPAGGYMVATTNKINLTKRVSSVTGNLIGGSVSDLDTSGGAKNEIMISVTYQTT